jgi:Gram positive anchor.
LSCVVLSAAVLVGISTPVHADTAATNSNSLDSVTTTTQSATKSANDDVQDGGNVEQDFPDVNNELGYASKFHIFANEATLNSHTNGNVAVGTLNGNVNFGTNIHEGHVSTDVSYVQNINSMANSSFVNQTDDRMNKVIFGENNDVDVSNANRTKVNNIDVDHLTKDETHQDKNGNKYIDFGQQFKTLENKSAELTTKTPQVSVSNSDFPDQNQRVINLEDYEVTADNKIVIDLDPDVLTSNTPLTIYGLSQDAGGTNVIINVDTKGQDHYVVNSQIKLIYNNGKTNDNVERPNQETEYFDDNHLLWNFYDSTAADKLFDGKLDIDRPFQGSVLAPKAEVTANANLDGNIVADKVVVNAETHRWDYQDDSDTETEYEKPITIPGELPDLPGEENNNGGNIENPNEEEEEEDIDPDTGELVEGGNEGEDPEPETPTTPTDPQTPEDKDKTTTDESSDSKDGDDNLIIHGGSEGTDPESSQSSSDDNLLPTIVGEESSTSQTPTSTSASTSNNSGSLPQTGETTGIVGTILGLIMLALGTLLKVTHLKKEN